MVSEDSAELVVRIAACLTARNETLVVAESATGGLISHLLTNLPGSSAWFRAGVVAYSNASKRTFAGVDDALLQTAGAVSPEVARAMASGVRTSAGATWALAETGIAGPQTGRRSGKQPGLACLAVVGEPSGERVEASLTIESGLDERLANKQTFAQAGLRLLLEVLEGVRGR